MTIDQSLNKFPQVRLVGREVRVAEADVADSVRVVERIDLVKDLLGGAETHLPPFEQAVGAHGARHEAAATRRDGQPEVAETSRWRIASELQQMPRCARQGIDVRHLSP